MSDAIVHPLPKEANTMCSACLTKATHFIVISYSHGKLTPVCVKHIYIYGKGVTKIQKVGLNSGTVAPSGGGLT